MYKVDDYWVYKGNVCKVKNNKDYYILISINDSSLVIEVSTNKDMV